MLNAYISLGHNPGGFRTWWRLHDGSDELLDDTHLMRMAGRSARRVQGVGAANELPVIFCNKGSVSTGSPRNTWPRTRWGRGCS